MTTAETGVREQSVWPLACSLELATLPNAALWARRHTVSVLACWQTPADVVESARLVVSELVTNATVHTVGELRDVTLKYGELEQLNVRRLLLRLIRWPERLLVEVYDPSDKPPVFTMPTEDTERGRGLFLVASLAERWSYYPVPDGGKVVWAELAVRALAAPGTATAGPTEPIRDYLTTTAATAPTAPMPLVRPSGSTPQERSARPRRYVTQTAMATSALRAR